MQENLKKSNYPFVTIMYGIGTLFVVFGHSHPLHSSQPFIMDQIIDFIYDFHMPLFFFIAGILIGNSQKHVDSIFAWWIKKCKKLMIPYIVLSLLGIVPKFMLGNLMNDDMELSVLNIIKIILIPRNNVWGHFWFIPVFLILELIGMIYIKFIESYKRKNTLYEIPNILILSVLWGGILLTFFPIDIMWFGLRDISAYLIYVLLGIVVFEIYVCKDKFCLIDKIIGIVLSITLSIIIFALFDGIVAEKAISVLMIYFIFGLSIRLSKYKNRILNYIGKRAFTIFIWSWPIQAVVEIILVIKMNAYWFLVYPTMFCMGLFGSIMIYEMASKKFKNNKFVMSMIGV